ncbi:YsnF/AvaK domain-containing protein [Arthrobacter deserti]|uniref:YsnF/AvaK domain-containing protein n=1 Tax=Arthrobacter deserti TaxID=1742687 RepID=A0ABX1JMJ2_9MICC|nr:YsnF/AvaK domain-containing protein [Arthrobacter deserti]
MIAREHIDRLAGTSAAVIDPEGNKIGTLGQLYLDDNTEAPNWATVKTGLFGMSETFVPLTEAVTDGDTIRIPYTKDQVKDAPRADPDGHLSEADEDRLYQHYGLAGAGSFNTGTAGGGFGTAGTGGDFGNAGTAGYTGTEGLSGTAGDEGTGGTASTAGYDTSGPTTDDAMTRSEEQLSVGTETRAAGRARLRKYIVTENVTQTVPVSREEVVIEREPITDANRDAALSGPDLSEEEHEVVLHEERPVVKKETVPVERVRLGTETVTDQETVTEEVRKEQIEADGTGRREQGL